MRDADNIRDISALGVDMIGLIFYPSVTPICAAVQQWGWHYSRLCTRHGKDATQGRCLCRRYASEYSDKSL